MRCEIVFSWMALAFLAITGCWEDQPDYWESVSSDGERATDSESLSTGQCNVDTENAGCLDTSPSHTASSTQTTDNTTGTADTGATTDRYPDFCGNPDYLIYAQGNGFPFDRTGAPTLGAPASAEVVLDIYAYFYCSHCREAAEAFAQLYSDPKYARRTALYFGHYAFSDNIEDSPWDPHRAAHAAHLQGKFWAMHDAIFAAQGQLNYPGLSAMAQTLGLDMTQYAADYASADTAAYLMADRSEVKTAGATSTPAVFVNGIQTQPWTTARDIIDCLLGY